MLPWWIRHSSRELPALAAVAAILLIAGLGGYVLKAPSRAEGEQVEGEIVGFHSVFLKGQLRSTQIARVRLEDGRVENVPLTGPAVLYCRAGDRLVMIRRGAGLVNRPGACPRR